MIHNVAIVKKSNLKFFFYKDYWDIYPDFEKMLKVMAAYVPYFRKKKEGSIEILKNGEEYRFYFGNFGFAIIIFGADTHTDPLLIHTFMRRTSEMLQTIFSSEEEFVSDKLPKGMKEFSTELELMIRASADYDELSAIDKTVEQRTNITPASEELARRDALITEQTQLLVQEFGCEFPVVGKKKEVWKNMWDLEQEKNLKLDFTRPKFFMTSSVGLKESGKIESTTFEVKLNFREYPKPPTFTYPQELEDRIGPPQRIRDILQTVKNWDFVHPPTWTELVRELEQIIYKTDTHLVEPIIEEAVDAKGKKKKGGYDFPAKKKGA
ncbi:MAG: hypothetical protein ACTSRW_13445 [Candidatus Helarchaeota archaeon]